MTLKEWIEIANVHTEQRGERTAVLTRGFDALDNAHSLALWSLDDYIVWAKCGPYTELVKREPYTHCR